MLYITKNNFPKSGPKMRKCPK